MENRAVNQMVFFTTKCSTSRQKSKINWVLIIGTNLNTNEWASTE